MKVTLNNIGKKYESREDFTLRHINLEIEDWFSLLEASLGHDVP